MKTKLENVQYSARYVMSLYYDHGTELNLPFDASYIKDDPVFRYIAVDNLRRNRRKFDFNQVERMKHYQLILLIQLTSQHL